MDQAKAKSLLYETIKRLASKKPRHWKDEELRQLAEQIVPAMGNSKRGVERIVGFEHATSVPPGRITTTLAPLVPPVSTQPLESNPKHFNIGDSFGLLSLVIAVIQWLAPIPLLLKPVMLAASSVCLVVFFDRSHWTYKWSRSRRLCLGIVLGVSWLGYAGQKIWSEWRGREMDVFVRELRIGAGNAKGCILYSFESIVDYPTEEFDLRAQLPMNVASFKVGTEPEFSGRMQSMAFTEVGKTPEGECYIRQADFIADPHINGVLSGPGVMRISGNDLPVKMTIIGVLVLSINKRDFPATLFSSDGSFSYKEGEMTISKPLRFKYRNVDAH
jgi:hypothetical protein